MSPRVGIVNFSCVGKPVLPEGVVAITTLRNLSLPSTFLRSALRRLSARTISWFEDDSSLEPLRDCDTVILADYFGMAHLASRIDRRFPKLKRKIFFFWNLITDERQLRALPHDWEIWTFDPGDAQKYDMKYAGNFYFPSIYEKAPKSVKINCDLLFIGLDKGRFSKLRQLRTELSHLINAEIDFIHPVKSLFSSRYARPMTYDEYLARVARAHAILDWNRPGQQGFSMRPYEALALGKKLVTNNRAIASADFYHPANILILTPDNLPSLPSFLAAPMHAISPSILSRHTFSAWLEKLGI